METPVNINSLHFTPLVDGPTITELKTATAASYAIRANNKASIEPTSLISNIVKFGHKKRNFAAANMTDESTPLTKKQKIGFLFHEILINDNTIIFPYGIDRIANNFLQIFHATYEGLQDFDSSSSESEEDSTQLITINIKICLKNSLWQSLAFSADSLEGLYEAVAQALIEDHSVITLIEYLIAHNYNWQQQGSIQETLAHYLITLPDCMLAFDKFDPPIQLKLLTHTEDEKANSPLLVLTKLYCYTFNPTFHETLKGYFDVISDLDNHATHFNDKDINKYDLFSIFELIIYSSYFAFNENDKIIKAYLEIAALIYVYISDNNNRTLIINQLDNFLQKNTMYSGLFYQYVNHLYGVLAKTKDCLLESAYAINHEQNNDLHFGYKANNSYHFFTKISTEKSNSNLHPKISLKMNI